VHGSDRAAFESQIFADAVVDVHDIVADAERAQILE